MKRVYLLPNVFIVSILLILLTKTTDPLMIGLYVLIGFLISGVLLLLKLYILGKYYLF